MTAESYFASASPCTSHAYLDAKGVKPYGIRQADGSILVPMRDLDGNLQNLQAIAPAGEKQFFPDGKVNGCCHLIDGTPDALLICEGYATGASLHEATGYAVAIAFHADNLEAVALALKAQHPDVPIIIAADNDNQTPGQPSLTAANTAAQVVGCPVAVPDFGTNNESDLTNFNDLHQLLGPDAVKRCIDALIPPTPAIPIGSVPATPAAATNDDSHRNAPIADPACLYGLIGDIAREGSKDTEANPYAVAASAIAYLSAAMGRGPFFSIGDDRNHPRLFLVHVGRSSLGRKGTAKKLMYRIHKHLKAIDEALAPQVHSGGLSSREGLVLLIHDGYKDAKMAYPAVVDKRLLVVESEFSNVLHQTKRDGNTLSGAMRDAWDGTTIKPAVKNCPVGATDPHISIMGDVTPSELVALIHKRELTNGFANRIIFFWAEGDKVVPFPPPTPDHVVADLVDRVAQVLRFAGAGQHGINDVLCMEYSPGAKLLYESLYRGELRDRSAGDRITSLLDRRAPMLMRLAMLFALTDQTTIIAEAHLNAAMAWVRYWVDSVKFIFQSAEDEAEVAATTTNAQKIITYLTTHGQADRTELIKNCFGNHIKKAPLDKALDELILASPPIVTVSKVPRPNGKGGSPSTVYSLCTPPAAAVGMANPAASANPANPAISANCANSAPAAVVTV